MNFYKITREYYAKWLDVTPEIMDKQGVILTSSTERDVCQIGYQHPFSIYSYITDNLIIISHSRQLTNRMENLKVEIQAEMTAHELAALLGDSFKIDVGHSIKFYYDRLPDNANVGNVKQLTAIDYPLYLEFFNAQHPNADPGDWLEEYFIEISEKGYVFGIIEDKRLVSVTDAPDMPYMQDDVQEIGINTLVGYRSRGYAREATIACIKNIISKGTCPIWSCNPNNVASERLAYSVGYKKLADVLTISMKEG